jgi:type I restriction enzyme M protein
LGDTLIEPKHLDMDFDAIVSNPPYSIKWEGEDNPILINDARYAPAGILAPKSKADLAFTMHMLHHLSESGVAAIVEFPGVLYRGGAEQKIRKYLLEHNAVDAVIQLPANLFFGVGIATCIIVLRKGTKSDNSVLFVDASNEFEKEGNKNYLRPKHQDRIAEAIEKRQDEQYFCRLVSNADIIANDCNLSVSSYVEQPDTREKIDIAEVNEELKNVVAEVNKYRQQVDDIVKMLEG